MHYNFLLPEKLLQDVMKDVSNRVYVSNGNIQSKKDSLSPYSKEKINLHGNDHIPIPKLEGHQKTNVPSVIVTNPITSIDISQVEKQLITSEAEKLKEEAKRIINEIKDYDSSDDNNIQIRKHYKSYRHHKIRDFEPKIDENQPDEIIQDSHSGEIEEKRHRHSRHRHHH